MQSKFLLSSVLLILLLGEGCRASFRNVDDDKKKDTTVTTTGGSDAVSGGDEMPNTTATAGTGDGLPGKMGTGDSNPGGDNNGTGTNAGTNTGTNTGTVTGGKGDTTTGGKGDTNTGTNTGTVTGGKGDPQKQVLIVTTPSPEIKAGGLKMPAHAKIKDGQDNPPVTWSITGPAGRADIGSIDANGIYTSPKTSDVTFPVVIKATLIADATVSGTVSINVLPPDMIFARCTKGNMMFPILAKVYEINSTAQAIPDFSNSAQARYVETVCMDKYAVAPRNFDSGFPDVPNLYEFFALQTTTTLIVPADGDYTFQLNSDDGSRYSIDGVLVIDNDGQYQAQSPDPQDSQTTGMKEVTLHLLKGDHDVSLNYFQGPKFRIALELKWKVPGSNTFDYVPTSAFK